MSASGWGRITKRYRQHVLYLHTRTSHVSLWNAGTYLLGRGSDKERREGAAAAAAQRPAVWSTRVRIQKDAERGTAPYAVVNGSILLYWRQYSDSDAVHGAEQRSYLNLEWLQAASQLASQLAGVLTVTQLRSRCWLSGAPRSQEPLPCWNKWALCWRAYTIVLRHKHTLSSENMTNEWRLREEKKNK